MPTMYSIKGAGNFKFLFTELLLHGATRTGTEHTFIHDQEVWLSLGIHFTHAAQQETCARVLQADRDAGKQRRER